MWQMNMLHMAMYEDAQYSNECKDDVTVTGVKHSSTIIVLSGHLLGGGNSPKVSSPPAQQPVLFPAVRTINVRLFDCEFIPIY